VFTGATAWRKVRRIFSGELLIAFVLKAAIPIGFMPSWSSKGVQIPQSIEMIPKLIIDSG
jgi:hypothetical protein